MVSSSAHRRHLVVVERFDELHQRRLAREELALRGEAVEERGQVLGELVEQAEEEDAVGVAGLARALPAIIL
jgi:hypothetical protein